MTDLHPLVLTWSIILNSIEISSGMPPKAKDFLANFRETSTSAQHQDISSGMPPEERDFLANFGGTSEPVERGELSSRFGCSPNCNADDRLKLGRSSPASHGHQSLERHLPPVGPPVRGRSRSPLARSESSPARCMVPPTAIASGGGRVLGLNQLELIRVIPDNNQQWILGLRKYTFPLDASIKLRQGSNNYIQIPRREHIVLATSDSEVYAILDSRNVFAGLYGGGGKRRMKINMISGEVSSLTKQEIDEIPVGELRPITNNFTVELLSQNPAHTTFH